MARSDHPGSRCLSEEKELKKHQGWFRVRKRKAEPQELPIGMFGSHSSPWHFACPGLLVATSTEKSAQSSGL